MKNRKGFTLIEMLVVVAIIGLLSSVVVVGLGSSRSKARDAKRIADIQQIQNALELAYDPANGYPDAIPNNAPQQDPQGVNYSYARAAGNQGYSLGICLENSENSKGAANCPSGMPGCANRQYCVSQ
ncbi:MAG TPA: prepilin-type N-terminal cleavage/methylation domain-containing protein [Candidatus Paceibacterota bacterium]|nr:prepilin-type N-terminal cleavage/methylation domain-containing protein [Candidatus Paceibacterota bacterium]